jgi:hypothetical protein
LPLPIIRDSNSIGVNNFAIHTVILYFTTLMDKSTLDQIISLVDILVVVVVPAMTAVMRDGGGGSERQGSRRRRQQQQQRQVWRWRRGGGLQGDWLWPLGIT